MFGMMSTAPGGPETLEYMELPTPEPGPGEVRIKVEAAGINFPDTLIIRDLYQHKPPRPFAPGGEVAGLIDAIGEGVTNCSVGERVLGVDLHGGYATHMIVTADNVCKIPDTMPFEEAAGFLFTYGTSYYALKDRGTLKAGETLLVLGAAGGVGAAAIELGKAMGARVIAAVSTDEKAEFCRDLGADATIIYPRELDKSEQRAFGQAIKDASRVDGVDVVYDAVGGNYSEPALRSLNWEGRFLVIGFPAGIASMPLNLTLLKSCQIVGVFWGAFTRRNPERHSDQVRELLAFYERGQIKPRISRTFSLQDAQTALKEIENRNVTGKVVLTMS